MRKAEKFWIPWLFLLPALTILIIFTLYPIICGSALAFFKFSLLSYDSSGSLIPPRFTGIDNFCRLFHDKYFHTAIKNSLLYVLIVPVLQIISVVLARLLKDETAFSALARTALYIPVITSSVVVGIVWKWLLKTDGFANQILSFISGGAIKPVPWLTDTDIAIFSVMLVTLWQGVGYYLILYLASLQAVPRELEEHAALEGASPLQIFLKIELPLIKPAAAVCSLLSLISALKVFTEIYIMTGGGPQGSTLTASYYIYTTAFEYFDMGYAAAIALLLAAVIAIASLGHRLVFKSE